MLANNLDCKIDSCLPYVGQCEIKCSQDDCCLYSHTKWEMSFFRKPTKRLNLPLGFFWAKNGLAFLENVRVVIIPKRCRRASLTRKSSLRLIGVSRLWLHAGESYFGISSTSNSSFMPMSKRCRASMSWIRREGPLGALLHVAGAWSLTSRRLSGTAIWTR